MTRYEEAGRHSPWLILRDLDLDAECPAALIRELGVQSAQSGPRIAVRAVEAWLLADTDRAAQWLGVAPARIPRNVESIADPKRVLFGLAMRSRRKAIRQDIPPIGTARIGPGYVDQVRAYCQHLWRPTIAARGSDSLARCLAFIRRRAS